MSDRRDRPFSFRTKESVIKILKEQADAANRSMSQQIEFLILQEQKRIDKKNAE